MSIIRSIVGCAGDHDAYQCMTGWSRRTLQSAGGYPSVGSVVAKLQGSVDRSVPPVIGLAAPTRERRWSDSGSPGFLGAAYAPFKPFMTGATPSENTQKLVGAYETNGSLSSAFLTAVNNAATTLLGASTWHPVVWARPFTPPPGSSEPSRVGSKAAVTGHRVPDLAVSLRSRRI